MESGIREIVSSAPVRLDIRSLKLIGYCRSAVLELAQRLQTRLAPCIILVFSHTPSRDMTGTENIQTSAWTI
jgi:hypothetical protein